MLEDVEVEEEAMAGEGVTTKVLAKYSGTACRGEYVEVGALNL